MELKSLLASTKPTLKDWVKKSSVFLVDLFSPSVAGSIRIKNRIDDPTDALMEELIQKKLDLSLDFNDFIQAENREVFIYKPCSSKLFPVEGLMSDLNHSVLTPVAHLEQAKDLVKSINYNAFVFYGDVGFGYHIPPSETGGKGNIDSIFFKEEGLLIQLRSKYTMNFNKNTLFTEEEYNAISDLCYKAITSAEGALRHYLETKKTEQQIKLLNKTLP